MYLMSYAQTIVKFPKNMSDNAKSCLAGLLEKDPLIRLGGGSGDAEDVKGHSFFSGTSIIYICVYIIYMWVYNIYVCI